MNSSEILESEFLVIRAKILEIAAFLDRIDRAEGEALHEQKLMDLHKGIGILSDTDSDRAKRVQLLFSNEYREDWQREHAKTS